MNLIISVSQLFFLLWALASVNIKSGYTVAWLNLICGLVFKMGLKHLVEKVIIYWIFN